MQVVHCTASREDQGGLEFLLRCVDCVREDGLHNVLRARFAKAGGQEQRWCSPEGTNESIPILSPKMPQCGPD